MVQKYEFAIADIRSGDLNALVKNLAKELGLTPEAAVRLAKTGEVRFTPKVRIVENTDHIARLIVESGNKWYKFQLLKFPYLYTIQNKIDNGWVTTNEIYNAGASRGLKKPTGEAFSATKCILRNRGVKYSLGVDWIIVMSDFINKKGECYLQRIIPEARNDWEPFGEYRLRDDLLWHQDHMHHARMFIQFLFLESEGQIE